MLETKPFTELALLIIGEVLCHSPQADIHKTAELNMGLKITDESLQSHLTEAYELTVAALHLLSSHQ